MIKSTSGTEAFAELVEAQRRDTTGCPVFYCHKGIAAGDARSWLGAHLWVMDGARLSVARVLEWADRDGYSEADVMSAARTMDLLRDDRIVWGDAFDEGWNFQTRRWEPQRVYTLYRFYSAAEELLYIGMTHRIGHRLKHHQANKNWYAEVATIRLEHFPTEHALCVAEKEAIRTEHPKYNVVHNRRTP